MAKANTARSPVERGWERIWCSLGPRRKRAGLRRKNGRERPYAEAEHTQTPFVCLESRKLLLTDSLELWRIDVRVISDSLVVGQERA